MATINVKATVSAPSEINIPLIRADDLRTSNVYRVFFEVFLAGFSTTFGVVLTMTQPTIVHWVLLGVFAIPAVAFLICFFHYGKAPKVDAKQNDKG